MLKDILTILSEAFWLLIFWLVLLLPLISFKFGIMHPILPALEIIFVYYFSSNHKLLFWLVFIAGILFDKLYSMPIGTNSLAFLLASLFLQFASKWFILKKYATNLMVFYGYSLLVFLARYLIVSNVNATELPIKLIILQYLATIFAYPLIRIILDKSLRA